MFKIVQEKTGNIGNEGSNRIYRAAEDFNRNNNKIGRKLFAKANNYP
jgi:hypothetical protein